MTAPLLRLARSAQYVGALTSTPSRHRNNGPIPVVTPEGRLPYCRRKFDLASRLSRLAHPAAGRHPRLWGRVGESELAMGCHLPQPPFNVKAATALPALAPPVSAGPELQPLHDAMPSFSRPQGRHGRCGDYPALATRYPRLQPPGLPRHIEENAPLLQASPLIGHGSKREEQQSPGNRAEQAFS
jgi:hypothetical protein